LRTYAQYLGLNADKVIRIYGRYADEPPPPAPPGKLGRVERAIAATRIRDNQRFLLIAAAIVLVSLIGVGLVSRKGGPAAAIPTPAVPATFAATTAPATVDVSVHATGAVEVTAVVDGVAQEPVTLRPRETVSYSATEQLQLSADDGGLITLTVGGVTVGKPGELGTPWSQTFVATTVSPSGSSAPP